MKVDIMTESARDRLAVAVEVAEMEIRANYHDHEPDTLEGFERKHIINQACRDIARLL